MAETVFSSASLTNKLQDILMKSSSSDASVADRVDNDNDGGVEGRDDIDAKDQQLLQVANNLFRRKKFPEAAKGYRNVLEISVSDMMKSRASNNLCHLLYKRGNLVEALAFAKKRTELRPTNYKGYFWLALISVPASTRQNDWRHRVRQGPKGSQAMLNPYPAPNLRNCSMPLTLNLCSQPRANRSQPPDRPWLHESRA